MTTHPPPPTITRKVVLSVIAIALGLLAAVGTKTVVQDEFDPIVELCNNDTLSHNTKIQLMQQSGHHAYEPKLGGNFVCIITQFLHHLVLSHPMGMIWWLTTFCTFFPTVVLMVVEAGRSGIVTPFPFGIPTLLAYPTFVLLLGQLLGVSVSIPLLWVPSYIWSRNSVKGTVSITRGRIALACIFPATILSGLLFYLDPTTPHWTKVAACLGGPLLALAPMLAWFCAPPPESQATHDMVYTVVNAYSTAGVIAFTTWAFVIFTVFQHYGLEYTKFQKEVWVEAPSAVKFMVIDAVVLYGGIITYIAYIRLSAALETLAQTILFGPGAAIAMMLAQLEMERSPIVTKRVVSVSKKES